MKNLTKKLIIIALLTLPGLCNADTVIGLRCYQIEPPGAPQDNAWEEMWVVEIGEVGSGVFSSVGFHYDGDDPEDRNFTFISATSLRTVDDRTGEVLYMRKAYGSLGQVKESIELAEMGDVEAMYNAPRPATFTSLSLFHPSPGGLSGTFLADVWHHDGPAVEQSFGFNAHPGVIYSVPCS